MAAWLFFGDCIFDGEARQLLRDGSPVDLSPKVFDALKNLIDARPRAVPQKELYDALWPDTTVEIASLYNVIHALRTALGDSSKTIIRTVYDWGFAFAAEVTVAERDRDPAAGCFELEIGRKSVPLAIGSHLIGRDFRSVIPITSPSISRRHARILVTENIATIEDLGSTNGTLVSGQHLETPVVLHNGDLIVFGDALSAIFHAVPSPASTAANAKKEVC